MYFTSDYTCNKIDLNKYFENIFSMNIDDKVECGENVCTISLDLPGYKKSEISVVLNNSNLDIVANGSRGKKTKKYLVDPDLCDTDNITSSFEDGVLVITVPKKESKKPKTIVVK